MSFQPILPLGGYAGWAFLTRTLDRQQAVFDKSPAMARDTDYFTAKIGEVDSAGALVADRRLLRVALGAFGLGDDIDSRHFIRTVLEDGSTDTAALANKLSDKRYLKLAEAFGFGPGETRRTGQPGFAERIVAAYRNQRFETAVGEQDTSLRLALNLERELSDLAARGLNDASAWFSVMGSAPLRQVFDTAFGLPDGFAALDLDDQLSGYRAKAEQRFGSAEFAQFAQPERREELVRAYLLQAQVRQVDATLSSARTALTLLGG
ncbi:hypothetical protein Ga0609869_001256 [Rhodovulum iodosum]|uniref:DUF1217 domain-containing protein n=1 Tax=Rhodovulum iodosum TaxID=68291 RepID=A0ABV3XU87_9RHOB|nr:DUF1217 domain-containing protein [Rhodovulum robiginosum]RSK40016.1 DUF1217 domain-containing protein [Rhodovulum robiginosum]